LPGCLACLSASSSCLLVYICLSACVSVCLSVCLYVSINQAINQSMVVSSAIHMWQGHLTTSCLPDSWNASGSRYIGHCRFLLHLCMHHHSIFLHLLYMWQVSTVALSDCSDASCDAARRGAVSFLHTKKKLQKQSNCCSGQLTTTTAHVTSAHSLLSQAVCLLLGAWCICPDSFTRMVFCVLSATVLLSHVAFHIPYWIPTVMSVAKQVSA